MAVLDERALGQLLELIGGDEGELRELIEIFLVESKEMLEDMTASQKDHDLDLLRRSAHSLKSSSQDFGAIRLSELSASLESNCKTQWPESANKHVEEIKSQFEMVSQALKNYLQAFRA